MLVQPSGLMVVRSDDSYLISVVAREMGVYEDEDVGDSLGEGEGLREQGPGAGIRVEDDG